MSLSAQTLSRKFDQAINWNAILSILQKIVSTALSLALYYYSSPASFNAWANINSIIFITLLWIDGGLRKSLPRFAPLIPSDYLPKTLSAIFIYQISAIAISSMYLKSMISLLGIAPIISYSLILSTFFLEGMLSLTKIYYHSFLLHRMFNKTYSKILLIEGITALLFIIVSTHINIDHLFIIKNICTGSMIMWALYHLPNILTNNINSTASYQGTEYIQPFIKHTAAMWVSNGIKSLSERNALMPLITSWCGIEQANIFKIANDGVMLVYRVLIKTVGTIDTSVLACSDALGKGKVGLQYAFEKITTKIGGLCFPVLGIILNMYTIVIWCRNDHIVFHILFIMSIGYMIEFLFSPYERVLEVNFNYAYLVCAYMPYLLFISFLFLRPLHLYFIMTSIGLVIFLACLHVVRLVSSLCMCVFSSYIYDINYPLSFISLIQRIASYYVRVCCIYIIGIGIWYLVGKCLCR